MRLALLVFAVALAGCQSNFRAYDAQIARIPNQCRAQGFKDGTPEFLQCQQVQANLITAQANAAHVRSAQMQQAFANMAAAGAMQPAPAPSPMPVQCTSIRTGYGYSTRCF